MSNNIVKLKSKPDESVRELREQVYLYLDTEGETRLTNETVLAVIDALCSQSTDERYTVLGSLCDELWAVHSPHVY